MRIREIRQPPGPSQSIIFLRNFNDFPPHTEGQLRLRFCEFAKILSPQDHQNHLFSLGISMIFLPILRGSLGSDFANLRNPLAPKPPGAPKSFVFLLNSIHLAPHTEGNSKRKPCSGKNVPPFRRWELSHQPSPGSYFCESES